MFLMNGPPVAALQSPWEAFGPPGSCRLPGCCSESPEGGGDSAVSARVQMVLSRLRCDKAALGRSRARALHGSPPAERGADTPPAPPAFTAHSPAAALDPAGAREATGLGPLVLDSDSDDSVDRDIEEAIQAYLQAKSGAAQPPRALDRACRGEPELRSSTPTAPGPPRPAPGSGGCCVAASEDPGATSPVSASSEDSFEQSIRAEIEAFLHEKRQHQTKCGFSAGAGMEPGGRPARPAPRPGREPAARPRPRGLPGACREFVFRKPSRLTKVQAQPRTLRSRATPGPGSLGSTKPATPGRPLEATHGQGQEAKRGGGLGRRGRRAESTGLAHEASESSSDDGIEEAIQLYQLEKRRGAGGDPLGEEQGPSPATQSALPEAHRKAPGRKKPAATKALDLGPGGLDPDHPCPPPRESPAPTVGAMARGESGGRASSRADTSAELMCAEAILDISKAILPAPVEGGEGPRPVSPCTRTPDVPSRAHSDGSSVDSDDSIEQEIRTFLALKAQSAGSPAPQSPRPAPALSQAGGPKASLSHPMEPPLSCRRRRRGSHAQRLSMPKKAREAAKECPQDADPSQGSASEAPGRDGESRTQPPARTLGLGDGPVPEARGSPAPGQGPAATARSGEERESSGDKSSSLDSDEDLDTAIKDLLRSKRRKRWKDPRAPCRKRVRFGGTTQLSDVAGGLQKGWAGRSPRWLKSCIPRAAGDSRESPAQKPLGLCCSGAESSAAPALQLQSRATGGGLLPCGSGSPEPPAPSPPSEDSSSVDSDDSIELEIRKFLAAKAKESPSVPDVRGAGPATPGAGSRRLPAPPAGVCTRSQRGRGASQLASAPRGTGRAAAPSPASAAALGGRSHPRAEQAGLPAALPRSGSGTACARGRRNACAHRDPSPRGAEPAAAAGEGAFGQLPSCAGGAFPAGSRGQGMLVRNPACRREAGPPAGSAPPWGDFAHQSRLQSAWALGPEGRGAAWRGDLGGMQKGAQARCTPSLVMDPKKGLPFSSFSPLLSTQLFHFGKSVPWGGKPASLFSAPLSLPLAGPSFSAFREAQAGPGPVFGSSSTLVKKAGGQWPPRKPQAGLSLPNRRNRGPADGGGLKDRQRVVERDEDDQEALGSDASELSDASAEDGSSSPVARSSVLQL
ncbi:protein phosphatase 1 regulatory subunit 26 [Talpa occidentalis]|uniref:protein phosphatase 1 regulatory subunit 26 n=1 Tax=Talpa occidentalis TaxID=50954 RepID=UPI00188EF9DD|nr:protein phosphatase 1 regulatory subunit 26 [Talpa occidentalis]